MIGLYDVDSKIPNLSLMRISGYYRQQGIPTELYMPIRRHLYDRIYASKIFNFSSAEMITPDMIVGGTGIDLKIELPAEMQEADPDYGLYNFPHSIGFAMRGCRFKCSFCVVPEKEGRARANHSIAKIWTNRGSDFLWLLDNDFFGNPQWRERIEEIRELNLRVCFLQGLNIRIITEEQAHALASVRFRSKSGKASVCSFAWDRIRDEKWIRRGIDRLQSAGIKTWQMQFFVLIGYDTTEEEDLHRVRMLKSLGCDPYAMPYDKTDPYQKKFCRWVNHRAIFQSVEWEDYTRKKISEDDPNQLRIFGSKEKR
jgi:hypothetical protein